MIRINYMGEKKDSSFLLSFVGDVAPSTDPNFILSPSASAPPAHHLSTSWPMRNAVAETGTEIRPCRDQLERRQLSVGLPPLYVVGVVVSRDLLLVGAATYLPQDRWIPPTMMSKANTGLQFMLCVASVASGGDLAIISRDIVQGLAIATVSTTALSGVQYIDRFTRATRTAEDRKGRNKSE